MGSSKASPHIPGYDILEQLDEGGMATVWLARSSLDDDLYVIKSLRSDRIGDDTLRARFLREATVTANLEHPGIARTVEAGETDDGPFIAMEYIAGTDLKSFMSRWTDHRVPVDIGVGIALQVLDALSYLHAIDEVMPIVHRDLAPANVMIDFEGRVKLIDFGIVLAAVGHFRTAPGTIAGTIPYMSPEQARAGTLDGRSDLYTVAAVLYELLTGHRLAKGTGVSEILVSVSVDAPTPPTALNPSLSPALDAVLLRALEKDPADRFQTAGEFAAVLRAKVPTVAGTDTIGSTVRALFPDDLEDTEEIREESVPTEIIEVPKTTTLPRVLVEAPDVLPTPVRSHPPVADRSTIAFDLAVFAVVLLFVLTIVP